MAFKKLSTYNEERFGRFFLLRNDSDYADVIFMYRSMDDALEANTHYIKSADYSGYVHCNGRTCPACAKGIRVQPKIFIPLYNITTGQLEFWDRTIRFENQLNIDVFSKYPNPSEFVFRIQRHGAAGDVNTTYSIIAVGRNNVASYEEILTKNNATYPEYYENVCREVTDSEMTSMLNQNSAAPSIEMKNYNYDMKPRAVYQPSEAVQASIPKMTNSVPIIPDLNSDYNESASASESIDLDDDVNF